MHFTKSIKDAVQQVDLVQECVPENEEIKKKIVKEISKWSKPKTIIASSSSGLLPSKIQASCDNPQRFLIAHPFNPVYILPLVEIVKHEETTEGTISRLTDILKGTGSQPIIIEKETPGFVTSRLQSALLREALWLVENEIASASDVDKAISHGLGRRWASAGIFEILELAGWDLLSIIATNIFPELSKSDTPKLLNEKVNANKIGIKTKKGFYEWTDDSIHELKHKIAKGLVEIQNWDRQKSP